MARTAGSADLGQLFRERGEDVDALVADDRQILDPHAAETLEVDTRLDRDRVARAKRVTRLCREARCLVHRDADPVPEPVAEVLAEAGVRDRCARKVVRLDPGHPRLDVRARALLRLEADVVRL